MTMGGFPFRLVSFDLDGTLTTEHGWLAVARATHRLPEYERSQAAFFGRSIGEDAHLDDLLALAVGMRVVDLEAILATTPKIAGISATLGALRRAGVRVALLTHNPEYVCAWYARTFGFDDFEGVDGHRVEDGRIVGNGPAHADKLTGLARLLRRTGARATEAAHVGDGWADAAIFPHVGFGVAFHTALPEVRRAADATVDGSDLGAILPALASARPRSVANDAPSGR